MINPDSKTSNLGRGVLNLDTYQNDAFTLFGYHLTNVLDDIILVEYKDSPDGRDVVRNGIVLPMAHIQFMWRIGRVLLAGPNCKTVKYGDYVTFPNDKGIKASNISVKNELYNDVKRYRDVVFLNEGRIFGICESEDKIKKSTDDTLREPPLDESLKA